MSTSSVWERYPDLEAREFSELVAVTAQVLSEADDEGDDVLERSTRSAARDITPSLQASEPTLEPWQVQAVFEDEALAVQSCRRVLDEVRAQPELAARVAAAYEERRQKMTGIELVLLAGALVVLAIRVKRIRWGDKQVDFEPSGEAVSTFVAGLAKGVSES
jgi:hypothetical protein